MDTNPCLCCEMINEDKNNDTCTRCDRRVRYVEKLERTLRCCPSNSEEGECCVLTQ
jgi:hypothetical protein